MKTRIPPQSFEAEQAVLGSMILERQAILEAQAVIGDPGDFYRPAHREVFVAMVDLAARGEPVDLTTLGGELEKRGHLEKVGGPPYLASLLDAVPTAAHVQHYARIVADKALLRRLIVAASDVVEECYGDVESAGEVASRAEATIRGVVRGRSDLPVQGIRDGLESALARLEAAREAPQMVRGVPSGLAAVDQITNGFQPGSLVYVAGRPGMGKTSLMMTTALAAARAGAPALLFSFEMSDVEVAERWIQMGCQVCSQRLRSGHVEDSHWRAIVDGVRLMWELRIAWYSGPPLTPQEILVVCRRVAGDMGLGVVLVDYLQLMHLGRRWGSNGRTQEVDEISRSLKAAAQELGAPVVVGSQLSREVEKRSPPRPILADLRESGSIEADANIVLMLFNPAHYARQRAREDGAGVTGDPDDPGVDIADVIIAKHRSGPTGSVKVGFQRNYSRFVNLGKGD